VLALKPAPPSTGERSAAARRPARPDCHEVLALRPAPPSTGERSAAARRPARPDCHEVLALRPAPRSTGERSAAARRPARPDCRPTDTRDLQPRHHSHTAVCVISACSRPSRYKLEKHSVERMYTSDKGVPTARGE